MTDARAEAVEAMANAAWNGSNELKITHNQYDGIAKKMLDALLSSGLAVLMGSLEQVEVSGDWVMKPANDSTDGVPLYTIRSREEEGT